MFKILDNNQVIKIEDTEIGIIETPIGMVNEIRIVEGKMVWHKFDVVSGQYKVDVSNKEPMPDIKVASIAPMSQEMMLEQIHAMITYQTYSGSTIPIK